MAIGNIKLVFLITDSLLFCILAIAVAYFLYARQHEHLYAPWRYIAKSRVAMGAGAILLAYLSVAVVDSIHFQRQINTETALNETANHKAIYSDTISLLDVWLQPLRDNSEKTYSAPFATHLYVKVTVEKPDGSTTRDYPRLKHVAQHLETDESVLTDSIGRSVPGIIKGLLITLLLLLCISWRVHRQYNGSVMHSIMATLTGKTDTQWQAFIVCSGAVFILGAVVAELSSVYHVLGTDKIGESVLYQSLKSIRTGLLIGTLTTLVMLPFAIVMGIAAGYFRGWIDDFIQYLYTTLNSIPGLLLIASAILMLQVHMDNHAESYSSLLERADLRLVFLCMILGVTSWTGLCRYLRAESLRLREMDYIAAARTMGVSHTRILGRHILPNVMHLVLITVVLDFSGLVLAEAVLAYVQIGVDPTTESWGNMINSARLEMARDPAVWWSLVAAFIFMLVLVLAANLFSDVVRDALDPRMGVEQR